MNYNKIISLVYQAQNVIFSNELSPEEKNNNPNDFVTSVDIGISNFLKQELYKAFPNVGFVTEEEQEHNLSNKTFILDPIDGTTNLIYDYKMSSISLAYVENNQVEFGVVFNPFTNEMFFAIKGNGAYLYNTKNGIERLLEIGVENYNENRLESSKRGLSRALIEFGAGVSHKQDAKQSFERARRVFEKCLDLRRVCSTAISICYIASGRLDGYFEQVIKPWDFAAGILILSEAGGKFADWNGNKLPLDRPCTIVCANSVIFNDLLDVVKG